MIIDGHQHFWKLDRGDYSWLTSELKILYRDYLPEHLLPVLKKQRIEGTILVQAAPTIEETHFMLSLGEQHNEILGVVGWVDMAAASAADEIDELSRHKKLVGLRPMIQDIADVDWMLSKSLEPAFNKMIEKNLTFDALTTPKHLPNLLELLSRFPNLTTVIDHASKPDIKNQDLKQWRENIIALAKNTTTYCKLSGLVTEAEASWTIEDLKPVVDVLLESFGPQRIIWGSDWPVCLLTSSYGNWLDATHELLDVTDDERALIMGGNAVRAYGLSA